MNIGVVHNKQDRTTGGRYHRAFTELGHDTTYYDYNANPDTNNMGHHDFVLMIDNADWHIYPPVKDSLALYYAVDTGIEGGQRCLSQSRNMNFHFYAQKRNADLFIPDSSAWLPHAFDDTIADDCDERFVGRQILLSTVGDYESEFRKDRHNIRNLFNEFAKTHPCQMSNNMSMVEMYNLYYKSMFVLNHNTYLDSLEEKDINLRTFEAAGCGAIQLIDRKTAHLEELGFVHGETCLLYETDEEIFT
jgi:hypothetical protein